MSAEFEKIVLEKLNILDELKFEVANLSKKVENNTALINRGVVAGIFGENFEVKY